MAYFTPSMNCNCMPGHGPAKSVASLGIPTERFNVKMVEKIFWIDASEGILRLSFGNARWCCSGETAMIQTSSLSLRSSSVIP